jgi:di/tricarboxylate transporter
LFLLCAALIITSLTVAGLEYRSLLITAAITAIFMITLGVVTQQEARDAIQWDLYMTIASAFGIGTAMKLSRVAGEIAKFLVDIGTGLGIGGKSLVDIGIHW